MDSVDESRDALEAPTVDRRREAARYLFSLSRADPAATSEAVDELTAAVDDEDPRVRGHALATLSHLGELPGAELSTPVDAPSGALVTALTDPDGGVRQTAVGLLSAPENSLPADLRPDAAAGLVECLADDSDLVRLRAAETLSASAVVSHPHPDRAVEAVLAGLDDDRTDVRTNLGETLAALAIDHPDHLAEATDRLDELLDADAPDVRASAGFAVTALDGDESALRTAVQGLCDLVPVEERWAGDYWMRQLLKGWISDRPGTVASAIESHDETPPELSRLARRIRQTGR